MDTADDEIFNRLGKAATYTPSSGSPVSCMVDYLISTDLQPSGYDAVVWQTSKTIEAILDVIGKEPDAGETFTITLTGEVLTVKKVIKNDGRFVTVAVK